MSKKIVHHKPKSPNYFSLKNPFLLLALILIVGFLVYFFVYKPNISLISKEQNQVSHAQEVSGAVPVGTIIYWPNSSVPTGFLECNGQSTDGYDALKAVVGNNVPDLKGQFVRGWNSGRGTAQSLDSGRGILTTQGDDNKSHAHSYIRWTYGSQDGPDSVTINSGDIHYDWANTNASGGTEARPYNVALMAIIKY